MSRAAIITLLTVLAAPASVTWASGTWASGAQASGVGAEDRYGPPPNIDPAAPSARSVEGWLNWPAKASSSPAAQPVLAATSPVVAVNPPRFYSVHRQFGLSPDPIPLSAQFFSDPATPDLAAPPPPLGPHPFAGSQAPTAPANTAANRTRAMAQETADSAAD
jgi:hypothetical protein